MNSTESEQAVGNDVSADQGSLRDPTRPSPGSHYLWHSGRYQAERDHRGHGGDDGEHGVGVGEPSIEGVLVRPTAATVEATATQMAAPS